MVMNESSLMELNRRIGRDTPLDQFRPNLMIKAEIPFDEVRCIELQILLFIPFENVTNPAYRTQFKSPSLTMGST